MSEIYRPPFIKQLDGSAYGGLNCTMASACMAIIRHVKGVNPPGSAPWYPTPRYLRAKTGDTDGGTNLRQADWAAFSAYGVDFDVEYNLAWATFRDRIERGMGAIVQGRYSVFKGTSYDAAPGFYGNHAIYINELRYSEKRNRWEYLMYDPIADGRRDLPQGPSWISEDLLQKFAAKLVINNRGDTVGTGKVWCAFTVDTEGVILRWKPSAVYGPKVFYSKYEDAAVRRSPNRDGTLVYSLDKGDPFTAYQVKKDGDSIEGSRTWYGNHEGTKWIHSKNLTATKPTGG